MAILLYAHQQIFNLVILQPVAIGEWQVQVLVVLMQVGYLAPMAAQATPKFNT